jgi:flagellar motor switch/type III secretory pathway protein FliN
MDLRTNNFAEPADASRAKPLRSWTSAQIQLLGQRIYDAHQDWCTRWGVPPPMREGVLVCEAGYDRHAIAEEAKSGLTAPTLQSATYAALFADEAPSLRSTSHPALADELAQKASDAWRQTVGAGLVPTQHYAGASDAAFHAWDGRLKVRICMAKTWLEFSIDAESVQQRLGREAVESPSPQSGRDVRGATERVMHALHSHPLHLGVHLDRATLTLGELTALQPGDVIALNHSLSDPMKIHAPDGSVLAHAWLGQSDGQVAVRLHGASHTPSSPDEPPSRRPLP